MRINFSALVLKRIFDIVASFFGLLILSPLMLALSAFIKIFMPGPTFFRQQRFGKNGISFTIIKFRTMDLDHNGNHISIKGEERITSIGETLRRFKLDELPELWNVLKGDMSFVGPRPDMPLYAEKLQGDERLILKLRPGITGPATIKYSNEEELLSSVPDPQKYNDEILWPDKVKINLDYYHNRSFWGDIKIILQTIF